MNNKVESAFYKTIMEGVAKYVKKNTPTYTTAKVVSIDDDGTPYVQFPGADSTTPVTTVTNAAKGDEVLVQVNSNGDAYVYGNLTDQPVSKVEVDKITENTTNVLEKFDYSLQEIIKELTGKFVEIGDSDIQVLSSNIIKNSKGLNLFSAIGERGDNYIHTDETGLDIKTITVNGELNDTVTSTKNLIGGVYPHMHFGKDYILYGQTWQTTEASIGERAVGFGNVRPNSKYAFAAGNTATVQSGSDSGAAFNSGSVQNSPYGFAANNAKVRDGYYAAAFNNAYADGQSSFATGSSGNFAKAMYSAVFGCETVAEGKSSIAEGYGYNGTNANTAKGIASHVSGYITKTGSDGDYSFVTGMFNVSNYVGQMVVGRANVNKADTIFEVGNGKVRYNQTYAGFPLYDKLSNSNGFEVTEDGYIRTGVGMEKIGFGKESNVYGYFIPPDLTLPQVLGYYYNTKFYEEPEHLTEITGESGKLYKDQTDGATILLYRWENNEFIDADTPVFIAWGSGGGGGSYTAGDGIDISATNEISADNTIARMTDIPTNVSDLTNDSGFITIYDIPAIPDELADLSDDSTHRLVTDTEKSTWNGKSDFSGSYNDLADKPTIPAAQVNSDWNATSGVARILNKPTLATVATSGSYNDLSNKPTIPSVGNGTINIQKNGSTIDSFTTNQSSAKTINISISKSDVGLGNVENKSSATIRGELTSVNVIGALEYTPVSPSDYMTFKNCPKSSVSFRGTASSGVWYTIFEFSAYTTAILKIIAREWSVSTNFIFINSRYTNGDSTPSFTILGGSYNNGGYNGIRICRKTQDLGSRCSLDILYDGNGEPIEVEVLYCSSTDYNLYNQITPALYSYEITKIDHKPKDSIETSGDIAINYKGSINYGPTPNYANNWSTFLSNAEIDSTSDGLNISIGANETSGIHLDGNKIVMWSPCDDGALWYYDEDDGEPVFHIDEDGDYYNRSGNKISPQVNSDWKATSGVAKILNKPTLATVATSGSYNDLSNKPSLSYLPLSGGTMNAGARITFTNSASEDGVYLTNGSYELRLIIGSGGVNRGLWDGSRWMLYEDASNVLLNSPGSLILNNNTVINHTDASWNSGLRINSVANNAAGSAHITFGGPSGSYTGTNDSYPMYQIGKTSSNGGSFFLNSRISGVERVLMYGNNTGLQFYSFDQTKQVDIQNDGIRTRTNKLYLHGKDNNYSDGSGEPSSPLILDGFESGQITANSSENTNVDIASTGDELVLVFLSAASGNSFYAVRLLRNNNGTLQTINLASNGTSIATISLNANQTNYITIKNTSSSYRLYYKILKLS